jgi:cytochrome c oxidase subunit 2
MRFGHGRRIALIWLVSAAICMTLVATVLLPYLPPGTDSLEASGQRFDNEVLMLVSAAVVTGIFTFFAYVLIVFRERSLEGDADGPALRGHAGAQTAWIVSTTLTVLALAGFGTYELLGGAGGGQGSRPIFIPAETATTPGGKPVPPLQVQVIAQQWQFTYRYPDEGGFESARFVLPVDREVELHVTSLDVIHSFWVPALGVKADANPGVDNIAYVTATRVGPVTIHCAELCGLFHGYMFDSGRVVSERAFAAWASAERRLLAPVTKYLPHYSDSYLPAPAFRG